MQAMARCHGQFFAPAKIAFPPSMAVMARSVYVQGWAALYIKSLEMQEQFLGYVQEIAGLFKPAGY